VIQLFEILSISLLIISFRFTYLLYLRTNNLIYSHSNLANWVAIIKLLTLELWAWSLKRILIFLLSNCNLISYLIQMCIVLPIENYFCYPTVSGARLTKWFKYPCLWLVLRTPPKTPYIYNIRGLSHGCRKNIKIPLSVICATDTPQNTQHL
jgi:hypothetical protein